MAEETAPPPKDPAHASSAGTAEPPPSAAKAEAESTAVEVHPEVSEVVAEVVAEVVESSVAEGQQQQAVSSSSDPVEQTETAGSGVSEEAEDVGVQPQSKRSSVVEQTAAPEDSGGASTEDAEADVAEHDAQNVAVENETDAGPTSESNDADAERAENDEQTVAVANENEPTISVAVNAAGSTSESNGADTAQAENDEQSVAVANESEPTSSVAVNDAGSTSESKDADTAQAGNDEKNVAVANEIEPTSNAAVDDAGPTSESNDANAERAENDEQNVAVANEIEPTSNAAVDDVGPTGESNDADAAQAVVIPSSKKDEALAESEPQEAKADSDDDQSQVGEPGNNDSRPTEPRSTDGVWVVLQSFMRSALTRRATMTHRNSLVTLQSFARAKLSRASQKPAVNHSSQERHRLHEEGESKKSYAARESKVAVPHLSKEAADVSDEAGRRLAERAEAKIRRERDERRAEAVHKRAQKKSNKSIHAWKEREKQLKREQKEQQHIQAERLRKAKEYARQTKALARRHQHTQAALLANAASLMDPNTFSSFKYEAQRNFRHERAEEREKLMHMKLQEEIAIAEERLRMREQQKVAAKKQQLLAAMERREARERDLAERKAALEAQRGRGKPVVAGKGDSPQSVDGSRRKRRKKKPLYLRMQEHYHQNIVGKEEEERRQRLNSRKAKLKAVSLDEIKEHQKVHDREAAEAKKRMERKRMAALGQSELAAVGANNDDAASPDSGLYRGRNYERVRREKEEQQLAAQGPARRKQKIKQYSHLVREMYKPQIDSNKASEVAARRRKLNAQAAGPKRRTRADLDAERKKYNGAWREVNPLASKPSAAEASWKRQQDEDRRREEERLSQLRKAKAEANQRMGRFNRKAADRGGRANNERLAPLAGPMLAEQNLHIDDDDQHAMAILNKLRKLNSLTQY